MGLVDNRFVPWKNKRNYKKNERRWRQKKLTHLKAILTVAVFEKKNDLKIDEKIQKITGIVLDILLLCQKRGDWQDISYSFFV